jgi:ferritin-like metal-binding protein YciE
MVCPDTLRRSDLQPGTRRMSLDSLYDLFLNELKDIYSAEKQALRTLPRLAKAAQAPRLRQAFERHARETEGHIERLERIFAMLDERGAGRKCKGMEGLVEEGKELLEEDGDPAVIDAALISAAQRVEHYEIAAYGCVRNYADLLGYPQAARLLQKTLDEESATDDRLTKLAEGGINEVALTVGAEE